MTARTMSKKELAAHYKVSVRTLNKWLKPIEPKIGKLKGRLYTPKQVEIIMRHLG